MVNSAIPARQVVLERFRSEIESHRSWLAQCGKLRAKKWEDMLTADWESAVTEACSRLLLIENGCQVEPAEDPSTGGPDFVCCQRGIRFYVEATCLKEATVTKHTGISPNPNPLEGSDYSDLTPSIMSECVNKAKQCACFRDAPCLLAVGTLHRVASEVCFDVDAAEEVLTSESKIKQLIDTRTGTPVGETFLETDLKHAAFIKPAPNSDEAIALARRSISGLLLCGFGCKPWNVQGVLHVDAARAFDRNLLPKISFCRLKEEYRKGDLEVEWV